MSGLVDLHTHSNASDGTCAPAELVGLAAAAGLAGLALTDHDTLDGLPEARQAGTERGVRFLAGVELSTRWRDLPIVHLLGYHVDGAGNAPLLAACTRLRRARLRRVEAMVAKLNQAGVELELEAVRREAGTGTIGRPHVARALIACGRAQNVKDAFQLWLSPGKPGYVELEKIQTRAAVALLRESGAVPVLAHPETLRLAPEALEEMVKDLAAHGLGGIEAYWSQQAAPTVALCELLAERYGLLATGGSDFHGGNKPNRLGETALSRPLGLDLMDALDAAAVRA